jgi:hypothetical protein
MEHRITHVEPRDPYRVWIRFEDGLEGEEDLSDLAGRGVFRSWLEPGAFASCPSSGNPFGPVAAGRATAQSVRIPTLVT